LGSIVESPAWNTRRKECGMTIHLLYPLGEPSIPLNIIGGPTDLKQYVLEIVDGFLDPAIATGKLEYTYHDRLTHPINQINGIINELKRDPYSTRAVATLLRPEDVSLTDKPCLNHIQCMIRDDELDMQILIRSNDAIRAAPMNMFAFVRLQEYIAGELGVPVGKYTHRANSYHAYEESWPVMDSIITRYNENPTVPFGINYTEDWKEDMDNITVDDIRKKLGMLND
jgi:thymidylate synthase